MNLEQAKQLLSKKSSQHTYEIYIPSLKKNVTFLPLSVGQKKTIAKILIQNPTPDPTFNSYIALISMITNLSIEEINLDSINEVDKVIILSSIYSNNNINSPKFAVTCGKCSTKFVHEIDMMKFTDDLSEINQEIDDIEIENGDVKYLFKIKLPSLLTMITYKEFLENRKETIRTNTNLTEQQKESLLGNMESYSLINEFGILFIKQLFINGEEVEGFYESDIMNKFEFFDEDSKNVIFGDEGLLSQIRDNYSDIIDSMHYQFNCPSCQKSVQEVLNFSNFFHF